MSRALTCGKDIHGQSEGRMEKQRPCSKAKMVSSGKDWLAKEAAGFVFQCSFFMNVRNMKGEVGT